MTVADLNEIMSKAAQLIASRAEKVLCLRDAQLSRAYYYQSLPYCIIDAIFSLGVRYGQVEKVICTFSKQTDWQIFRRHGALFPIESDQKILSDFIRKLDEHKKEPEVTLFNNRGFANPRSKHERILKAKLAGEFASLLKKKKIETFQDLNACKNIVSLNERLSKLTALQSGIAIHYFHMLAGDDNQVKPDRMIVRFIKDAIRTDESINPDHAVQLIQEAASMLKKMYPSLTPRLLDHEIWKYQRQK